MGFARALPILQKVFCAWNLQRPSELMVRENQGAHAMRSFILFAVSAIALSGASLGQANAGTSAGAAGLRDVSEQLRITEPIARVCKEVCRGEFCRTRCFNERDRDEVVHERVF